MSDGTVGGGEPAAATVDLANVPWALLLALASLGIIYGLFRRRAKAFEEIGFSSREVALLCLGSIAGWAVNLPLLPLGNSYMAVNLGGALVPLILVGWWIHKRKLPLVRAFVGILLVSVVANRITHFLPEEGIVAVFPWFFLPSLVALAYALLVTLPHPMRSVPLAYAAGSLGALLGADVYNLGVIADHFRAADEASIVSMGGAGVFDMVFLAGTLAMATDLAIIAALPRRENPEETDEAPPAPPLEYPVEPYEVSDSWRCWSSFSTLPDPNPAERSVAALALSNLALKEGDYAKSVRMSFLAVDALLKAGTPPLKEVVDERGPERLHQDLAALARAFSGSREGGDVASRAGAGNANVTAKLIVATLLPRAAFPLRLEGA